MGFRFPKARQNRLNHQRFFDTGDDFNSATALAAPLDVDVEHMFERLCPCYPCAAFTIGGEHTVEARQIHSWLRHQCGELGNKVQQLENDMASAAAIRGFKLIAYLALRGK